MTNKTFLPECPVRVQPDSIERPWLRNLFTHTGKIALRNNKIAELGISHTGGVDIKFLDEGIRIGQTQT